MARPTEVDPNSNRQLALIAESAGEIKFNGKPCVRCGATLRYTRPPHGCVECTKLKCVKWSCEHKERHKELVKRWVSENREYRRMYDRARRQRIKEQRVG